MTRGRILALFLGLALGLAAAEALFGVLYPRPSPDPSSRFWERLLRLDGDLGYRLRPHVDLDWARQDDGPGGLPFTTNAEGRRRLEYERAGDGPPARIALLGDSSTMGFHLRDAEHYAARLGPALAGTTARPLTIENHAVIGYTSRQGMRLWRRDLAPRADPPTLLVWALGYNDSFWSVRDEGSWYAALPPQGWVPFHEFLRPRSNVYDAFFRLTRRERGHERAYPRELRSRYEHHVRTVVDEARARGTRFLLFELVVPNAYVHATNRRLARELDLPYVDARELIEEHLRATGRSFLPFELEPMPGDAVALHFRSDGPRPVLCLIDLRDALRTPHCIPFRDDGIAPDAVAGDGRFALQFPAGIHGLVEFTIVRDDDLARDPLHVNGRLFRTLPLRPGVGYVSEEWTWDRWTEGIRDVMQPNEFIHPNEEGHELIARGLAQRIAELLRERR